MTRKFAKNYKPVQDITIGGAAWKRPVDNSWFHR
jgi:hypothetical protein